MAKYKLNPLLKHGFDQSGGIEIEEIHGSDINIEELNNLKNTTGNIQNQLNVISAKLKSGKAIDITNKDINVKYDPESHLAVDNKNRLKVTFGPYDDTTISNRIDEVNRQFVEYTKMKYLKQIPDLYAYEGTLGEIVQYIGNTNARYEHGYIYEYKASSSGASSSSENLVYSAWREWNIDGETYIETTYPTHSPSRKYVADGFWTNDRSDFGFAVYKDSCIAQPDTYWITPGGNRSVPFPKLLASDGTTRDVTVGEDPNGLGYSGYLNPATPSSGTGDTVLVYRESDGQQYILIHSGTNTVGVDAVCLFPVYDDDMYDVNDEDVHYAIVEPQYRDSDADKTLVVSKRSRYAWQRIDVQPNPDQTLYWNES